MGRPTQCRRCDKPIETAAVSSADGQLKGKWHRACFTCFECDCPFDNDSFYVHADKPYCQLHYHQLKWVPPRHTAPLPRADATPAGPSP